MNKDYYDGIHNQVDGYPFEDLEREQRRREYEEHEAEIARDDEVLNGTTNIEAPFHE